MVRHLMLVLLPFVASCSLVLTGDEFNFDDGADTGPPTDTGPPIDASFEPDGGLDPDSGPMLDGGVDAGSPCPCATDVFEASGCTPGVAASGLFGSTTFSCAIADDLWCWGEPRHLGVSPSAGSGPVSLGPGWTTGDVGTAHACAINDSNLRCWGEGANGTLGRGSFSDEQRPAPVTYGSNVWMDVAAGNTHTCAVAMIGGMSTVVCWGQNDEDQLGNATIVASNRPVPTSPTLDNASAVAAGDKFSCAIATTAAELYCWGHNNVGQLGTGNQADTAAPLSLSTGIEWSSVCAGLEHACAITTNQKLFCWGNNVLRQVGTTTDNSVTAPLEVESALTWTHVACGSQHTCGVTTDGELLCWGDNTDGQLGRSVVGSQPEPVDLPDGSSWERVASGGPGSSTTCGIDDRGRVWCWGQNLDRQVNPFRMSDSEGSPLRVCLEAPSAP